MAAQLLYYGLTTGAGVQTLGEEYCDILQVTGMPHLKSCVQELPIRTICCRFYYGQPSFSVLSQAWLLLMPSGLVGLPPGTVQRGLLVLLQALVPYLADRVGGTAQASLHSAPWASHYSDDPNTAPPNPCMAATVACICPLATCLC